MSTNSNDATLKHSPSPLEKTCAFHSWVLVRIVAPFIERLLDAVLRHIGERGALSSIVVRILRISFVK